MAIHVIRRNGPPTEAPEFSGQHWIDELNNKHYLAKDTASVGDWLDIENLFSVFGNSQTFLDDGTLSTTFSNSYTTAGTFTTPNLPAGTYVIFLLWRFRHYTTGSDSEWRFLEDSSPFGDELNIEMKDSNTYDYRMMFDQRVLSGVHTFELQFASEGSDRLDCTRKRWMLFRVS